MIISTYIQQVMRHQIEVIQVRKRNRQRNREENRLN